MSGAFEYNRLGRRMQTQRARFLGYIQHVCRARDQTLKCVFPCGCKQKADEFTRNAQCKEMTWQHTQCQTAAIRGNLYADDLKLFEQAQQTIYDNQFQYERDSYQNIEGTDRLKMSDKNALPVKFPKSIDNSYFTDPVNRRRNETALCRLYDLILSTRQVPQTAVLTICFDKGASHHAVEQVTREMFNRVVSCFQPEQLEQCDVRIWGACEFAQYLLKRRNVSLGDHHAFRRSCKSRKTRESRAVAQIAQSTIAAAGGDFTRRTSDCFTRQANQCELSDIDQFARQAARADDRLQIVPDTVEQLSVDEHFARDEEQHRQLRELDQKHDAELDEWFEQSGALTDLQFIESDFPPLDHDLYVPPTFTRQTSHDEYGMLADCVDQLVDHMDSLGNDYDAYVDTLIPGVSIQFVDREKTCVT